MMYPILCKVKYESLHHLFAHRQIWVQLAFSIVANWIVAPLLMVCLNQRYGMHCSLTLTAGTGVGFFA
jgi:ACR3 family arsenite efflux pump ArsB